MSSASAIALAPRVQRIKPSPSMVARERVRQLQAEGRDVIDLTAGEPDLDTPKHIRDAAAAALEAGETRYTPVNGTPALRKAIIAKLARENGVRYVSNEISVGGGAKQVIYNALAATLGSGDGSDHPRSLLGLLSRHGRGLRRHAGDRELRRERTLQAIGRGSRESDHATDALAHSELPVQSHRRVLFRCRDSRARRGAAAAPPCRGHDRRHLRAHPLRWRGNSVHRCLRAEAEDAHPPRQWRLQNLCDDRLPDRLWRRPEGAGRGDERHPVADDLRRRLDVHGSGRGSARRRSELRRGRRAPPIGSDATGRSSCSTSIDGMSCLKPDGAYYVYPVKRRPYRPAGAGGRAGCSRAISTSRSTSSKRRASPSSTARPMGSRPICACRSRPPCRRSRTPAHGSREPGGQANLQTNEGRTMRSFQFSASGRPHRGRGAPRPTSSPTEGSWQAGLRHARHLRAVLLPASADTRIVGYDIDLPELRRRSASRSSSSRWRSRRVSPN